MAVFDYIIDQFILKGITEGLSGNVIQTALQAQGLGVRRQDLQARIRQLAEVPVKASILQYIPNGNYPTSATLTEAGEYQARNYFITVKYEAVDRLSGELKTYYQNISSDDLLTVGEAKSTGLAKLPFNNPNYDLQITSQKVISYQARPDLID